MKKENSSGSKSNRRIGEIPPKLGEILQVVNLLPPNTELLDAWEKYFELVTNFVLNPDDFYSDEEYEDELLRIEEEGLTEKQREELLEQALLNCLFGLPEEFVSYVNVPKSAISEFISFYRKRGNDDLFIYDALKNKKDEDFFPFWRVLEILCK